MILARALASVAAVYDSALPTETTSDPSRKCSRADATRSFEDCPALVKEASATDRASILRKVTLGYAERKEVYQRQHVLGGSTLGPRTRGKVKSDQKRRRALSTILATVITVAVAVVASIAVSGFVFGILGLVQNPGQIVVTGTVLPAAAFTASGTLTSFSCASTSAIPYLTLTNTGTGAAIITGVTITWAGTNNAFAAPPSCKIGASGTPTSTTYLNFVAASHLSATGAVDAVPGQAYTGTITLSNGAHLLFTGIWQWAFLVRLRGVTGRGYEAPSGFSLELDSHRKNVAQGDNQKDQRSCQEESHHQVAGAPVR